MTSAATSRRVDLARMVAAIGLPLVALLALTASQVDFGLNLSDEGFLWYGAKRTAAGEIPLRDFMAYEPGRYYWTAAVMALLGSDGIVATRWAAALFEAAAVAVTAGTVWHFTRSLGLALLCGLNAVLVMYCWHGRYEPSVALFQAMGIAWLLAGPTRASLFLNGLILGLSSFFGRNLALYGVIALVLTTGLLWRAGSLRRAAAEWPAFLSGAALGVAPLLFMIGFVDGYGTALVESVRRILELRTTNLGLAVPLPWTVHYAGASVHTRIALFLLGTAFLSTPLVGIGTLTWALARDPGLPLRSPVFVGSAVVSLPYAHYVLSRANVEHLSRGATPLVLAIALLPFAGPGWRRLVLPGALTVALLMLFHIEGPPAERWISGRTTCLPATVGRDVLCVPRHVAHLLNGARNAVSRGAGPGESVLIAPYHVTLYPALGLRAPVWEIYSLFPENPRTVADEIARVEAARTRLAIVFPYSMDGRPERSFEATHPSMTRHLLSRFEVLPEQDLPAPFVVLRRR